MSLKNMPPCPPSLKQIQHYLKVAAEHDDRDIVISYWCRLYALQLGLKTDRTSQEAKKFLGFLMDWLEKVKAKHNDNENIVNDIPAQAHLENYALRLFVWADSQDRSGNFNRNVIKAFYTAGIIYDVLDTFGEPSEDVQQNKKYAKWKAAYIHNCLKNGETPVPGPVAENENFEEPTSSNVHRPSLPFRLHGTPFSTLGLTDSNIVFPYSNTSGGGSSSGNPGPAYPSESPSPKDVEKDTASLKPPQTTTTLDPEPLNVTSTGVRLTPEQMNKAQKYCKWAASALNYDDVPTAVINLQKALQLLTTGKDE